jgi:hypothetical protein
MQASASFAALSAALIVTTLGAALSAQTGSGAPQVLCTTLTPETVGRITSRTYATTSSQIDNATLKHCEYRGGPAVVSVMLAIGAGARTRFDTAAKTPGVQPVPGVGDQASWEPVRGTLSVLAGEQSAEISVNASHGAPAARQQMATAIARAVLGL